MYLNKQVECNKPHVDCVFSFPLTNIQKTVSKMKPQGKRPP